MGDVGGLDRRFEMVHHLAATLMNRSNPGGKVQGSQIYKWKNIAAGKITCPYASGSTCLGTIRRPSSRCVYVESTCHESRHLLVDASRMGQTRGADQSLPLSADSTATVTL